MAALGLLLVVPLVQATSCAINEYLPIIDGGTPAVLATVYNSAGGTGEYFSFKNVELFKSGPNVGKALATI